MESSTLVTDVLTEEERMSFVSIVRQAAFATDRLKQALIEMAEKLEKKGVIPSTRTSKKSLEKTLQKIESDISTSDADVFQTIDEINRRSDRENIIKELIGDIFDISQLIEEKTKPTKHLEPDLPPLEGGLD